MGNRAERQERETEQQIKKERENEHWVEMFWRGSEMAVSEIEHQSIFINVNQ